MSWTLDPKYTPRTVSQMRALPRNMPLRPSLTAKPTTLAERIASAVVPDGRKWTDMRNKVQGAIEFATPLGAEQPLRDARSAYQGGNKWGAAGLGALAMLSAIPGAGTEAKAATKTGRGIFGKGIIAYHGSPHSFDKFSLDKIGGGEGAQAYGHGLYFAENEKVAKSYRDKLSEFDWKDEAAKERYDAAALDAVKNELRRNDVQHILDMNKQYADHANSTGSRSLMADMYDALASGDIAPSGSMYQVKIGANPNHFLNWDTPVTQQSGVVKSALKGASQMAGTTPKEIGQILRDDGDLSKVTGERFYEKLVDILPYERSRLEPQIGDLAWDRADAISSNLLNKYGIPGIRYLDGMSRRGGEGTSNYVVFDDALIEILKKYGVAVPAMGIGLAGMSRQNEGGM